MSKALTELTTPKQKVQNAHVTEQDEEQQQPSNPVLFARWLAKQVKRRDTIGELARSVRLDTCWPHESLDYISFRNHLRVDHSDSPITRIMALDIAWEEYAVFQKKFLSTPKDQSKSKNSTIAGSSRMQRYLASTNTQTQNE